MVPVSTGNLGNMQEMGNTANEVLRPNSAAANPGMNSLPNGMMADPGLGNPSMNSGLPNGSMGGTMLNGPLSTQGQLIGPMSAGNIGSNSPMVPQNFANGGMGGNMGSMQMGNFGQSGMTHLLQTWSVSNVFCILIHNDRSR